MNEVFLKREIEIGDTVSYNNINGVVVKTKPCKLKLDTKDAPITIWKKNLSKLVIDVNVIHTRKETVQQHLRHVLSLLLHNPSSYPESCKELLDKWDEQQLTSVANVKHGLCVKKDPKDVWMTTDETFFEFAYRHRAFEYCDVCAQYWTSKYEKNVDVSNLLSFITQPPMNTIIQEPVFCMFERERFYNRKTAYEKKYIERILETNEKNFEIEEPAYAEEMSENVYWNTERNDEVCIQLDHYDAIFLNTKIMNKKQFLAFLQDGLYKNTERTVRDHFPVTPLRRKSRGIHFVQKNNARKLNAPRMLFNFSQFEELLLENIVDDEVPTMIRRDMRMNSFYDNNSWKQDGTSISFTFTMPERSESVEGEGYDELISWTCNFEIKADQRNEEPVVMSAQFYRGSSMRYSNEFHILLFSTDSDINPLRLTSSDVNDNYEHPEERIVRRGKVVDKLFGQDNNWLKVLSEGKEYLAALECVSIACPEPSDTIGSMRFSQLMNMHERHILFEDKSYALRRVDIGLFYIPTTVYAPNKLRCSNGKIPKRIKLLSENWKYKRNEVPYHQQFMSKIYSLKNVLAEEVFEEEQHDETTVDLETVVQLLEKEDYLEFHKEMNKVSFQERNKLIMQLRAKTFNVPFNKIFACVMNRQMSEKMMKTTTPQEDWQLFFLSNGEKPNEFESFEVVTDMLCVSKYVKSKIVDSIGVKFTITPLILGLLMKKDVPNDIFNYCKNISVTDADLFPIHFVVNFVDDSEKRLEYVIRLLRSEQENDTFCFFTFSKLTRKWNPQNDKLHSILRALSEWPFDTLFQTFFLLQFAMDRVTNIYKKRNWFLENSIVLRIFSETPGHKTLEHAMRNYGYPDDANFIPSWQKGFDWLSKIGLVDLEVLKMKTRQGRMLIFEADHDRIECLKDYVVERAKYQQNCYKKLKKKINNKRFFIHAFLRDENIFFTTKYGTFYEYMLKNPGEWKDQRLNANELLTHYLNESPTLHPYFESLQGIYIDLRLSLFAQKHTPLNVKSAVLLLRNGGNVRQLRFLHQLITPLRNSYSLFFYNDLHDMLSTKLDYRVLQSDYLSLKYIGSSETHWNYPILTDRIVALFSEISILQLAPEDMLQEANKRVNVVYSYLNLYMKMASFSQASHLLRSDNVEVEKRNRYLFLLRKIIDVLFEVANLLSDSAKQLQTKNAGLAFSFLLTSPHWSENYIKDIQRYEYMIENGKPSLYSHVCILFDDELALGDLIWPKWKEQMTKHNLMPSEIFKIFDSSDMIFTTRLLTNAMHFIYTVILDRASARFLPNINVKHTDRKPDRRTNYEYLGRVFMNRLVNIVRIEDNVVLLVDKFLENVIVTLHHDSSMRKFDKGQYLWFLLAVAPSKFTQRINFTKRCKLFNSIMEVLLRLRLPRATLAFVKTFEKHVDYHRMSQEVDHVYKDSKIEHLQPNDFFSFFTLTKRNTGLLVKNYYSSLDLDNNLSIFWHILITNLHFNGILEWDLFGKKAGFGRDDEMILDFQNMHKTHYKLLSHAVLNPEDTFQFKKDDKYSVAFFVQQGLNPFLFDFMDLTEAWHEHLLESKMRLTGWPNNMFFSEIGKNKSQLGPYHFMSYASEISLDNAFTLNEGFFGTDYRTVVSNNFFVSSACQRGSSKRHRVEGKFILEATSFFGYTVLAMSQQRKLKFKDVMRFAESIARSARMHISSILMFPHAIVKSQLSMQGSVQSIENLNMDVLHAKVNALSLLELLCDDFTRTDLEICLDKAGVLFTNPELEKMKNGTTAQRLISADFMFEMIRNNVSYGLQFSDRVDLFQAYIMWATKYFKKINVDPQYIFSNTIFNVMTNHTFIEKKLRSFRLDMLTFAVDFGRTKHLRFFLDLLIEWDVPLWNLQPRVELQSTDSFLSLSGVHLYYIHTTKDPLEHLLYVAALNAHVNAFRMIFDYYNRCGKKHGYEVQFRRVVDELVRPVKFEFCEIENTSSFLNRKGDILQIIVSSNLPDIDQMTLMAKSYLQCTSTKQIFSRPTDLIRCFRPSFLASRGFMRSMLRVWGKHIFRCFTILDNVSRDVDISFEYSSFLNLSIFCQPELLKYALAKVEKDKPSFSEERKTLWAEVLSNEQKNFLSTCNTAQEQFYIMLIFFLNFELQNTSTSINEILKNGYLQQYLQCIGFAHTNKKQKNVFIQVLQRNKLKIESEEQKQTIADFCQFFKDYDETKEARV